MHHALLVPDVLGHILAYIKADVPMSNRTFAALARTCSALSEASLDALWNELCSLYPLVSCIYDTNMNRLSDKACLPYLCVAAQAELLIEQRTAEADTDAESDLSVFYKYAYRVRKLDFKFLMSTALPDDLGVFHVHQVPTPFLPNLNHLVWTHQLGPALVWPLLGPRLQSLHIPSIQWNSKSTPLFLSKIRGLCPELSSLTLQFYLLPACRAATESSISRVICSWKKLEVLDLSPAGSECILSFHVLSSLRVLSLRIDNSFDLDLPANSLSFPLLHTLRFQAISLRTAYSLLQAMRSLPKSVEISLLLHQPGDCGLELILCAIGQHTSCNILEELRMNRDIIVNDFNVLRPLFLCCNLRVLRMTMTPHFVDDDLCAVASAWPQLEILELFGYHIPYMTIPSLDLPTVEELLPIPLPVPDLFSVNLAAAQPPYSQSNRIAKFTFHGLISLLRLCPNLRFFNLTIDATKLDGLQGDKPGGGVCNRLVKRPRLVDSPINDPEAVARILFDILPELETVCGEGFVPDRLGHQPLSPGWARVQEIILASKAARGLAT